MAGEIEVPVIEELSKDSSNPKRKGTIKCQRPAP